MVKQRKLRVGVLFGGKSGEHEVSFCSAFSIINAMDKEKYEVIPIGITKDGRWLSPKESQTALHVGKVEGNDTIEYSFVVKLDVVFPVLHGTYGEDGTIQGLLELLNTPYVGSGVSASSLAMDKDLMKRVFQQTALPQTHWITIKRKRWNKEKDQLRDEIDRQFHFPLFVKPTNLGSSVGISKVLKKEDLISAIDLAASYDRKIIIEEGLTNIIEVECSVLGNDEPEVSVVGEVQPGGEYYDYHSKYIDKRTRLIIPARIDHEIIAEVQQIAKKAYLTIDAAGLARVDFFIKKEKPCQIYINEINTIPGFTQVSMYPRLWEKSGISFSELIDKLIQLALERHKDKMLNKTEYPSLLLSQKNKNF